MVAEMVFRHGRRWFDDGVVRDHEGRSPEANVGFANPNEVTVTVRVFDVSCARSACHDNGLQAAGLNLADGESYDNLVGVPSTQQPSLDRIEPFDPESSYLWLKVTNDPSITGDPMPLGAPPLDQVRLDLIESWIEAGGLDN